MKSELNKLWDRGDNEIRLFQKMSYILGFTYDVAFVKEVHARMVHFDSSSLKIPITKEIADVWIIAYSPVLKQGKMTFLQAKYQRKGLSVPRIFKADYFQYELLSQRLKLTSGGTLNLPKDILSIGCCDSIGSYGVFYWDTGNKIDMAYCCASNLTTSSVLPATRGVHLVDLQFPALSEAVSGCGKCHSCQELNFTYDINTFRDSILDLEIGADIQHHPEILELIKSTSAKYIQEPAVSGLLSFINDIMPNSGEGRDNTSEESNEPILPGHLFVINVDGREGFTGTFNDI